MTFHDVEPSRSELFDRFAQALESEKCGIYLDSSVLLHCYEMSSGAAGELLDAMERFPGHVHVPLWVAQEVFKHSRSPNLGPQLRARANQIAKKADRYILEAMRMADATIGTGAKAMAREAFETKLNETLASLKSLMQLIANEKQSPTEVSNRLRDFLRSHVLATDLSVIYQRASEDGPFRFAHGIPPGHADAKKKRPAERAQGRDVDDPEGEGEDEDLQAPRNPLGDLIVWFEILEHARQTERESIILLTRDVTKGDWVYDVKRVTDEQGRPRENRTIKLPWPLLDHEARSHCPTLQSEGLHIHSLEGFVQIASERLAMSLPKLTAALQRGLELSALVQAAPDEQSDPEAEEAPPPPEGDEPVATPESRGPVTFASSDLAYEPDGRGPLDDIGLQLKTNDWSLHARAIQELSPGLIARAPKTQRIFLGSALAHAGKASTSAVRRLEKLLWDDSAAPELLLGALAQVYMDEDANLTKPKSSLELTALLFEAAKRNPQTAAALLDRMQNQRTQYLALPDDTPRQIELTLRTVSTKSGPELQGAEADGVALLEASAAESRALSQLTRSIPGDDLIELIATEFVVPRTWLQTSLVRDTKYLVPARMGFVEWGPGTGRQLRTAQ